MPERVVGRQRVCPMAARRPSVHVLPQPFQVVLRSGRRVLAEQDQPRAKSLRPAARVMVFPRPRCHPQRF